MVYSIELSERHGKPARNTFQRRAYAAQRALIAIDKYSFLVSSEKSDEERRRTLRWMRAWMAFAVSYGESSYDTANRIAPDRRR